MTDQTTTIDETNRLRIIHPADAASQRPSRFVIAFAGMFLRDAPEENETSEQTWARVVARVAMVRQHIRLGYQGGDAGAWAWVYVDTEPSEEQMEQHHKAFILWGLLDTATHCYGKENAMARVEALALASRILGLEKPTKQIRKVIVKVLDSAMQ